MARRRMSVTIPKHWDSDNRRVWGAIKNAIDGVLSNATVKAPTVKIRFDVKDMNQEEVIARFEALSSPESIGQMLEEYLQTIYIPKVLAPKWDSFDFTQHTPKQGESDPEEFEGFESSFEQVSPFGSAAARNKEKSTPNLLAQGQEQSKRTAEQHEARRMLPKFTKLGQLLFQTSRGKNQAGLGDIGAITQERLNPKSPSGFNTFFYAAEFGTGVAENVGGAQFIRDENSSRYKLEHPPGAWRWGPDNKSGIPWTGQKALHFLYEPRMEGGKRAVQGYIQDGFLHTIGPFSVNWLTSRFRGKR